ncbi:hypothetical protein GCM10027612_48850 [Microbispora bryophytorum subsp. camponoti]|nr:hypothetical protein [Microbispora camponoti]
MPPIAPMLARPLPALPPADRTPPLYQPKLDGFRALAFVRDGTVYLQSRGGADLSGAFPDVAAGGGQLVGEDVVFDGELVVLSAEGRLDFGALQQRARRRGHTGAAAAARHPAHLVVFDIFERRDRTLMRYPQHELWDVLAALFARRALHAPWTLISCDRDRDRDRGERWTPSACARCTASRTRRPGRRAARPGARSRPMACPAGRPGGTGR